MVVLFSRTSRGDGVDAGALVEALVVGALATSSRRATRLQRSVLRRTRGERRRAGRREAGAADEVAVAEVVEGAEEEVAVDVADEEEGVDDARMVLHCVSTP